MKGNIQNSRVNIFTLYYTLFCFHSNLTERQWNENTNRKALCYKSYVVCKNFKEQKGISYCKLTGWYMLRIIKKISNIFYGMEKKEQILYFFLPSV